MLGNNRKTQFSKILKKNKILMFFELEEVKQWLGRTFWI